MNGVQNPPDSTVIYLMILIAFIHQKLDKSQVDLAFGMVIYSTILLASIHQ